MHALSHSCGEALGGYRRRRESICGDPPEKGQGAGQLVEWDPSRYRLVIPRQHAENASSLVGTWDAIMLEAERQKEEMGDDAIISFNLGEAAGQTEKHIHVWVVLCTANDPSAGRGLATMKMLLDELLATS